MSTRQNCEALDGGREVARSCCLGHTRERDIIALHPLRKLPDGDLLSAFRMWRVTVTPTKPNCGMLTYSVSGSQRGKDNFKSNGRTDHTRHVLIDLVNETRRGQPVAQ